MAKRLTDTFGDDWANIDGRVGPGGRWDDVMVVQGLLQLYWEFSKQAQAVVPSKPPVDGAAHKSNTLLISAFQKELLKRPKPQGFVNPATKFDDKALRGGTIYQLNLRASILVVVKEGGSNVVDYLASTFPKLAGPLGRPFRPQPLEQEN